jgi:hypothetical protein
VDPSKPEAMKKSSSKGQSFKNRIHADESDIYKNRKNRRLELENEKHKKKV